MLSRDWCEYETPFFSVYTDLKVQDALFTAEKLLSFHHATSMFFAPDTLEGTSLSIVLFRYPREFSREFNLSKFVGVMQPSFQKHLLLLAAGEKGKEYMHVPFHEYAHYIIRSRLKRPVARWLEEGLAQYLSTLQIEAPGIANIGEINRRRLLVSFLETKHQDWREILDVNILKTPANDLQSQYDVSWGLVHYLVHGSPGGVQKDSLLKISDLLERVNRGEDAFQAYLKIAMIDEDELESALYGYLTEDQELLRFRFDTHDELVLERGCLDRIDKHLLLASSVTEFNAKRSEDILTRLNRFHPNNHRVLAVLSDVTRRKTDLSRKYAAKAYEINPDVAETNVALASALIRVCVEVQDTTCNQLLSQAKRLYSRALELEPKRVDAAFGLGILYLNEGKAADALDYLLVSHQHAPWSARVNGHLGETYRQLGQFAKAAEYLKIAVHWETDELRREGMLEVLALVEKHEREE
ncbi:MAG: DUF1570 domain-containing protein [Gammaproteobacteria bacterium]|nr:DUF1570 domain-containing protein [Gammaproteobacteria bacterium]